MKKIVSLFLCLILVCSSVSAFAEAKTYGADNLNDEKGDLIIGYLGGSITEGSGASPYTMRYSTRVVEDYFKKNYPNKNVIERNASIGGTGSGYGMLRMERDLIERGEGTPDVVFVEFAVNDRYMSEKKNMASMEAIVRRLLALPKVPVIIFVYTTCLQTKHNPASDKYPIEYSIEAHHKVAENYGIYEINLNDYIWENGFNWSTSGDGHLTEDGSHPNNAGYEVYANRICELLEKDKAEAFKKLDLNTAPCGELVYGQFTKADFGMEGDFKRWSQRPIDMSGTGDYALRFYDNGYYYIEDGIGAKITVEFSGTGLGIDYLRTKDNADFDFELYDADGREVMHELVLMYYKTDIGRCCGQMIASELPYGKYKAVLTGVLNETAVNDFKESNGGYGGSGKALNIAGFYTEAPENVKVSMRVGSKKMSVNGEIKENDVQPMIVDGRTLVPIRCISEAFGEDVSWDAETQTAIIGLRISVKIGEKKIKVGDKVKGDKEVEIDVPAQIFGDRTYVPLRAIAESLGKDVSWDDCGLITISDFEIYQSPGEIAEIYKLLK